MRDLDLDEIERLARSATPGDWKEDVGVYQDPDGDEDLSFARGPMIKRKPGEPYRDHVVRALVDARFMRMARKTLPTLVARVRGLEAEVARLRDGLQYVADMPKDSIWMDDRDDAADLMVDGAKTVLAGKRVER